MKKVGEGVNLDLVSELSQAFSKFSKRVCVIDNHGRHSFSDVFNEAQKIRGFFSGKRVGILMQKSLPTYATLLSVFLENGAFLPLNPNFSMERIQRTIGLSAWIDFVVFEKEIFKNIFTSNEWIVNELNFFDRIIYLAERKKIVQSLAISNICYFIQTSGTTGAPKTICISRNNLTTYLMNMKSILLLKEHDVVSQTFDLSFDPSISEILLSWLGGASLAPFDLKQNLSIKNYFQKTNVTVWNSTPTVANLMLGLLPCDYFNNQLIVSGFIGESLSSELVRGWQKKFPSTKIFNNYGPAETTIAISSFLIEQGNVFFQESVPIGKIFTDHNYKISVAGELQISGSQISPGYLDQEQTEKHFYCDEQGCWWYKTGDRVQEKNGELYFLGRLDRQLKVNGVRIESEEIENYIFESIGKTATVTCKKESYSDQLVALIHQPFSEESQSRLVQKMQERYSNQLRFSEILFVPIELNQSGKIDHAMVIKKYYEQS